MHFQNLDETSEHKILEFLSNQKNILRLVKLEGNYDLSFIILAKTPFEFDNLLREIKNAIGNKLNSYEVELILFSQMAGLKFLGDKTRYSRMEFQGEPEQQIKIDELDSEILRELSEDARKPLIEIALKLKTSADVIKYRLKRLEKQKIITRYRHYLDLSKLGFYHFVILLKLQNTSIEDEKKIIEYLMDELPFMYTTKIIGSWDFEINLIASTLEEFNQTVAKLKSRFQNLIKSYGTIFISNELKLNYYPF
jgi:DNA-binding Lrp family transcriptional regulator